MIYHGPTSQCVSYFEGLHYSMPPGESMADWLIDISSGRLAPDSEEAYRSSESSANTSYLSEDDSACDTTTDVHNGTGYSNLKSNDFIGKDLTSEQSAEQDDLIPRKIVRAKSKRNVARCSVTDAEIIGASGVTTGKLNQALQEAKERRGWLYAEWGDNF